MAPPDAEIQALILPRAARAGRVLEFVLLFGLLPVLLASGWVRVPLMPLLWLTSLYCAWRLRLDGKLGSRGLGAAQGAPREWHRVLSTFALATPLLTLAVWITRPQALFALPLHHPLGWAAVMALYPPLSALPQELVFRAFFFNRYRFLFGSGVWLAVGSAVAFALTHLVFRNWIALALTLPGGLLFAHTYRRGGGLLLVTAEHALYGCLVFTLGYGRFLAEGSMQMLR
jgi:membrane protease YdiL (CAAX protease family)